MSASQTLAWHAVPHLGAHLMAALDESYQTLTLSVFAYSFSYSFTLRLHRLSMCGRGEEGGREGTGAC